MKISNNIFTWILAIISTVFLIFLKNDFILFLNNEINILYKTFIIGILSLLIIILLSNFILFYIHSVSFSFENCSSQEEFNKIKKPFVIINWLIIIFSILWSITLTYYSFNNPNQSLYLSLNLIIISLALFFINKIIINEKF
jgi:hypothetical protein